MQFVLINPRHSYAPSYAKKQRGHVYMPSSLQTVGARLMDAGLSVRIEDANLRPPSFEGDGVGFSAIGAPYLPLVSELCREVRAQRGPDVVLAVGGRVVGGLTAAQRALLFGAPALNGEDDQRLTDSLGIKLAAPEHVSLIPVYQAISDPDMALYLSNEFSLYLSQGCKFACTFCAAVRAAPAGDGSIFSAAERYRDIELVKADLHYLLERAALLGIPHLRIYLSNLDLFQTPSLLLQFAEQLLEVRRAVPTVKLSLRGLATVESFLHLHRSNRETLLAMQEAGLERIGFGIDGGAPEVWKAVRKSHHSREKCTAAVRLAREEYGLITEVLMVFGHAGVDTEQSLRASLEFAQDMMARYQAVPRPHVAKSFIPGNDGWDDPRNAPQIRELLEHPEAFQALDFTALPSRLTHPDPGLCALVSHYYREMCALDGALTQYTLPMLPELSAEEREYVRAFNQGKYDL